MPNGWTYTYRSHPHIPIPTEQEMRESPYPSIHKTPADYPSYSLTGVVVPTPPALNVLGRRNGIWNSLLTF
ncbi:hypothetical protein BBP40_005929 [Aspergillus hancockii]|nr:hypothetical protein BBP40_005929 [Aspergillus hancockii]